MYLDFWPGSGSRIKVLDPDPAKKERAAFISELRPNIEWHIVGTFLFLIEYKVFVHNFKMYHA